MPPPLSPRRQQILESAVAVLAAAGARGLTHRAVDREAGLAEGSTSAYFRSRSALLSSLAELVAGELAADVEALGARLSERPDDHALAVESTSELLERWLTEPGPLTARLELTLAATRDPTLAGIMSQWRDQLVVLVTAIITRAGTPEPARLAATTVAALEGVLLVALQVPAEDRLDFARHSVQVLLDSLTDPRRHAGR